jgi:hypothetical protein
MYKTWDGGPTATGTILVADLSVEGHPDLGRGARVDVFFDEVPTTGSLQHLDERNVIGVGCVGDLFSASGYAARIGKDEGSLTISGTSKPLPTCSFVSGSGYECIAAHDTAPATVLAAVDSGGTLPAGTARLTLTGAIFTADDVGRTLVISGAANTGNDAAANNPLPIIALGNVTNEVLVANSAAVSESFNATYAVLAGAAPVPNGPAFLSDTDHVTVALTRGGSQDFDAFTATGLITGTAFQPDSATAGLLTAIPTDGSGFELACDVSGGHCGNATITVLNITTSDTPLPQGAPPYVLPPASSKVATLTCSALGTSVAVSPSASKLIQAAAPKMIQAGLIRANYATETNAQPPKNSTTIALGHAIAGFTIVP